MQTLISKAAPSCGFMVDGLGAHSSRTLMLAELRLLLEACPPSAQIDEYRSAVLDENVLRKATQTTRQKSLRYLRELYVLDSGLLLFRTLRDLWDEETEAQPLLAILCAVARDPSLRATMGAILSCPPNTLITSESLAKEAETRFVGRLNMATLAKIGRNAASSWTQSGHLRGRTNKIRIQAHSYPTSVTYALLLGYLCGARGEALFQTGWAQLLDAPPHVMHEQAFRASQRGWLEYRHTGTVTDISFSHLLRDRGEQHERG